MKLGMAVTQLPQPLCLPQRAALLAPPKQTGLRLSGRTAIHKLRVIVDISSRRQFRATATPAAAASTASAATALWPSLAHAWNTNPAAVLLAASACILGVSLSMLLLAAVPTLLASQPVARYNSSAACACVVAHPFGVEHDCVAACIQALRRSAHAMETLLLTLQAEVPDTAATLRLSGLELADCIQEVGALR